MRRLVVKQQPGGSSQAGLQNSGFNAPLGVFGLWGKVIARHSEDHTVDITTDRQFVLQRVPVASRDWVTESDPPTGGRDLPPEGTYVFMLMPSGQVEGGFIIASIFPQTLASLKTDFLKDDKEEEAFSRVEGGWQKTYDKAKGDLLVEDDDGFTLKITKSDKKTVVTDWHGNTVTLDSSGIVVKDTNNNSATLDQSGIAIKDKNGNEIDMNAGGVTEKTKVASITGGALHVKGVVAPTGSGPFCAIPVCPFTGQPHTGEIVAGT